MKSTQWKLYSVAVASLFCAGLCAMQAQQNASAPAPVASVDPALLQSLHWRSIGPFRAGRAPAVAGDPKNPLVFYFGAVGGGVWKTTMLVSIGRMSPMPISNRLLSARLRSLPSDPNVIYAGTGEMDPHPDIMGGDGVYKSTDAGETWTHVGLRETQHIGRILVDPNNPDLVYVAALGHEFGPNPQRGVFRSKDGGKSWDWQSLQRNMPVVALSDMIVKDNDLVAATHGRSFWILDNITPLRQITPAVLDSSVTLLNVPMAYRPVGRGWAAMVVATLSQRRRPRICVSLAMGLGCTRLCRRMGRWCRLMSTLG